ncbi:hypothetical protein FO519_007317 [Halicephalobus sp. NKZ332]|nr:hypothetical protein FO519_007317 [Halicephalobus sp. NKZ332]
MDTIKDKLREKLLKFCDEPDVSIFLSPKPELVKTRSVSNFEDGEIFEDRSKSESSNSVQGVYGGSINTKRENFPAKVDPGLQEVFSKSLPVSSQTCQQPYRPPEGHQPPKGPSHFFGGPFQFLQRPQPFDGPCQPFERPARGTKRSADTMCHFFREGFCRKGSGCKFSHDTSSSRRYPSLCKFYENGHCSQKDRCLMLHGEYPCINFYKGLCKANPCRFSHLPLTDYTRAIIEKDDALQISPIGFRVADPPQTGMPAFRPFKAVFVPHPVSLTTACFALFSSDWRIFKLRGTENVGRIGLWKGFTCHFPSNSPDYCDEWYSNEPRWETTCKGLFIGAIFFNIISLISASFSFLCYDSNLMKRIFMFWPFLTSLLFAAGIILFLTNYRNGADVITGNNIFYGFTIGYSSFVMCGAFFLVFASVFAMNVDFFLSSYFERRW